LLEKIANIVRGLSADGVEKANSGHPGMPIGCAELGAVLFGKVMKYDPEKPDWPDRDRLVLSAGHGSMWLYSYLHLAGYDISLKDLKSFRQLDSRTPGHPEYGETPGVETTTGPLGQGFANAVGMVIAERMMAARYNNADEKIVDHYTYTVMGDGCMMEGISSEAASLAGHLGLGKLIAIYDDNEISIEGNTEITFTESVADRFKAFNWHVIDNVDGHDIKAVEEALSTAKEESGQPSLIIAKTHIALGAPGKQDSSSAHGAPLGEEEIKGLKETFNLPADKCFYISDDVKGYFDKRKDELQLLRKDWEGKFSTWNENNPELSKAWEKAEVNYIPDNFAEKLMSLDIKTPIATRKAAGSALQEAADLLPYLVGGSADLAPSNKTYLEKYDEIQPGNFTGRNFRFGVREHAMGSIANGISVHKGLRPYVATFLVFSDYMRPAIRMAALMKQPIIYVFTHDSVYIGEDGPTHQAVEHVESLRLIPGLKVIRPADEEEAKAAWVDAIRRTDGPTALILTRQGLPHLNKENGINEFSRGGYLIKDSENAELIFMASGSEVSLAIKVSELLENDGIENRVISVPDRMEFARNDEEYIKSLLGEDDKLRVIMEAGVKQGWYQFVRDNYLFVTVDSFGKSGPGEEVARDYGFIPEKIAEDIKHELKKK